LSRLVHKLRWALYHLVYSGRWPVFLSELRKRWIVFRHPNARIEFGEHTYVGPGFSLEIRDNGTFITGRAVEFRRGFTCEISGAGRIVIGDACIFTKDPLIQCTTSIEFGDRVMIGQSSMIADGNHRWRDRDVPLSEQGYDFEPLRIGDDVILFTKVTVVSSIGDKAVVAANAVVSKPVAPYTLVGGVPAKIIEELRPA
jgi:acetyltransferase-like isoleucine patch superfamily enzyme